jgi:hypothetical protein
MLIKILDEIKEKRPPKYTKKYQQNNTFSCIKQPPYNVFSPYHIHTKGVKIDLTNDMASALRKV